MGRKDASQGAKEDSFENQTARLIERRMQASLKIAAISQLTRPELSASRFSMQGAAYDAWHRQSLKQHYILALHSFVPASRYPYLLLTSDRPATDCRCMGCSARSALPWRLKWLVKSR